MCQRFHLTKPDASKVLSALGSDLDFAQFDLEVRPNRPALSVGIQARHLAAMPLFFGFMGFDGKRVLNARAETAAEKPMFAPWVVTHRCLLPASFFYETDRSGNYHKFESPAKGILYLAGLYDDAQRFVLLTKSPVDPIASVHPRMPIVLDPVQAKAFLSQREPLTGLLLAKTPALIEEGKSDQVQMRLF